MLICGSRNSRHFHHENQGNKKMGAGCLLLDRPSSQVVTASRQQLIALRKSSLRWLAIPHRRCISSLRAPSVQLGSAHTAWHGQVIAAPSGVANGCAAVSFRISRVQFLYTFASLGKATKQLAPGTHLNRHCNPQLTRAVRPQEEPRGQPRQRLHVSSLKGRRERGFGCSSVTNLSLKRLGPTVALAPPLEEGRGRG